MYVYGCLLQDAAGSKIYGIGVEVCSECVFWLNSGGGSFICIYKDGYVRNRKNMKGRRPEECERFLRIALLMLMLVSVYFIVRGGYRITSSGQVETKKALPCVVIDAGHGGGR